MPVRTAAPEDITESPCGEAEETGLLQRAGRTLMYSTFRPLLAEKISAFMSWCAKTTLGIRELGLKE